MGLDSQHGVYSMKECRWSGLGPARLDSFEGGRDTHY
jgi:hypothetical protein